MPTFDIVSEVDMHELSNAVDQANRELDTRFDFRGVDAKFTIQENDVVMKSPEDFHLHQMMEIFRSKCAKRNIDTGCFDIKEPSKNLSEAKQVISILQGLDKEIAKKITKLIKETKIKVQSSIQGEKIRVTGKKRDDLQQVMAMLREQDLSQPLQFDNFRD